MERIKNNIMLKYTIGLSFVTILILLTQKWIIKLLYTIGFELTNILLIFSVIVMPLIGLYIVTKICCKEDNIKHTHILTKIFIISIVLTIISAIYLGFEFGMFGNIEEKMLVVSGGTAEVVTKNTIESYEEIPFMTLMLIANIKTIIKALMFSTLYISVLIIVFVRYWVSNNISIEKEEKIKQIKEVLVATIVIIMIEVLVNVGVNIKEGNIPMTMTIRLESKITSMEKQQIENKLKEMDEIIDYEYIDESEASNEFKEMFEDAFGDVDSMSYDDYKDIFYTKNIERYDLTVHNKNVDSIKEALEGMNGIEKIQGMSFEF